MKRRTKLVISILRHLVTVTIHFNISWFLHLMKENFTKNIKSNDKLLSDEVIISMTSYPKRFKFARKSIKSLLMQDLKPRRIIIFLFDDDYKERIFFKRYEKYGVEVQSYPINLKSFLKIIPALTYYPNNIIVTADDDMYYRRTWLSELIRGSQTHPKSIVGHRGIKICLDSDGQVLPYSNWKLAESEFFGSNLVLTSVGGILYPSRIFSNNVLDMNLARELTPNNDDFWIYFIALTSDISQGAISSTNVEPYYWFGSQKLALWKSNVLENRNDLQFANLLSHFQALNKIKGSL